MTWNTIADFINGNALYASQLNDILENVEHVRELNKIVTVANFTDAGGIGEDIVDGSERNHSILGDNISIWLDSESGSPDFTFTAASHNYGTYAFDSDNDGSGPISLGTSTGETMRSLVIVSQGPSWDPSGDYNEQSPSSSYRRKAVLQFWQTADMEYISITGRLIADAVGEQSGNKPVWGRDLTILAHREPTSPLIA